MAKSTITQHWLSISSDFSTPLSRFVHISSFIIIFYLTVKALIRNVTRQNLNMAFPDPKFHKQIWFTVKAFLNLCTHCVCITVECGNAKGPDFFNRVPYGKTVCFPFSAGNANSAAFIVTLWLLKVTPMVIKRGRRPRNRPTKNILPQPSLWTLQSLTRARRTSSVKSEESPCAHTHPRMHTRNQMSPVCFALHFSSSLANLWPSLYSSFKSRRNCLFKSGCKVWQREWGDVYPQDFHNESLSRGWVKSVALLNAGMHE